ncbi:hypothetical protein B0H17DRAFT_1149303 [Mycena rosella]|uniref:Uncharacterized protein n=1 Tax=Mycena rosella TaxID=1033263 RepID=A0AAD7C3G4_MYCRO|nr:hypothetical protein B0H17DRAFT_1149303 [Mycena rosella]
MSSTIGRAGGSTPSGGIGSSLGSIPRKEEDISLRRAGSPADCMPEFVMPIGEPVPRKEEDISLRGAGSPANLQVLLAWHWESRWFESTRRHVTDSKRYLSIDMFFQSKTGIYSARLGVVITPFLAYPVSKYIGLREAARSPISAER